jgi:hypothetical protein
MGAKSQHRGNSEAGALTDDKTIVEKVMTQFDTIWRGSHCPRCGRKDYCADFKDLVP